MKSKIIKDSVHGYIEIEGSFVTVLNSAEFQRLKQIEQGSYRVLYPSARHDRFIHSLGVYHLSKLFGSCFLNNIREDLNIQNNYEKQEKTFHYACLMHDVGHAPFSHTTEDFFKLTYTDDKFKIVADLYNAVIDYINSLSINPEEKQKKINQFIHDYETSNGHPKPHEILSATLLIELAKKYVENYKELLDLELAARMVIGCTYDYTEDNRNLIEQYGVQNGFIRLLNSETVDVDKLDYIKRDNMMTGFENVSIDINRLAKSVTAIQKDDGIFPAFKKTSLSVIDNVFRAKEEQGKWIISHPVVLYDSNILSNSIYKLWDEETLKKIFSKESLSKNGNLVDGRKYVLLNDNDILCELKTKINFEDKTNLYSQIFDRNIRLKTLWKSKDEYKVLFGEKSDDIFDFYNGLISYLETKRFFILNNDIYSILQDDTISNIPDSVKKAADFLKDFFNSNNLTFEIAFAKPKFSFAPSFDADKVYIRFDRILSNSETKFVRYSDLGRNLKSDDSRYFYIYTRDTFTAQQLQEFADKNIQKVTIRERA